jgi:hypothetical protein
MTEKSHLNWKNDDTERNAVLGLRFQQNYEVMDVSGFKFGIRTLEFTTQGPLQLEQRVKRPEREAETDLQTTMEVKNTSTARHV